MDGNVQAGDREIYLQEFQVSLLADHATPHARWSAMQDLCYKRKDVKMSIKLNRELNEAIADGSTQRRDVMKWLASIYCSLEQVRCVDAMVLTSTLNPRLRPVSSMPSDLTYTLR